MAPPSGQASNNKRWQRRTIDDEETTGNCAAICNRKEQGEVTQANPQIAQEAKVCEINEVDSLPACQPREQNQTTEVYQSAVHRHQRAACLPGSRMASQKVDTCNCRLCCDGQKKSGKYHEQRRAHWYLSCTPALFNFPFRIRRLG
jgi:hypothetical protein